MDAIEREGAWCEWAYALGSLLGSAVPILQAMEAVAGEAEFAEIAEATSRLVEGILARKTIAGPARELPEPLPGMGVAFLRVGEVAGILDETLVVWADWLKRDLELRLRYESCRRTDAADWDTDVRRALPDYDRRLAEVVFLRLLGMCLGSGVPYGLAVEAAGEAFVTDPERAASLQAVLRGEKPQAMAPVFEALGLPSHACLQARMGDQHGDLDRRLVRAAEVLDYQLSLKLLPVAYLLAR